MQTAFHFFILTKLEFGREVLVKIHNPIFHEIHLGGKQLFRANGGTSRRTENKRRRQADMTKLIFGFFSCPANTPKNDKFHRKMIHV
jgi:hypothetical protein